MFSRSRGFPRLLGVYPVAAAGLPDSMRIHCACFVSCVLGADLVKVSGCNRRGSCARIPVPVCRFVSVSGSGCPAGFADPLRGSGLHLFRILCGYCIIVLVACSKILRFKRIRLLYIHFRVYALKMDSGRVLWSCAAFCAVPVPVLRVLIG